MSRFLALFLFPLLLFCFDAGYWQAKKELQLLKDQNYRSQVTLNGQIKFIDFRWTLYKNEGLVCHLRYDGEVNQFILYRDYRRDRFHLNLAAQARLRLEKEPFIEIVFKDFSRDSEKATVEFLLRNPSGRFSVDLEPKAI